MTGFYRRTGKRILDCALILLALPLLLPIVALVALLVRWKIGMPVLFRQPRPGRLERPFTLYKFRTMTNQKDVQGELLPDERRITPFGTWLRKTSLDELPELFNVLRGELSLVGPRPLLDRYLPFYTGLERRRFEIRPGITGWAQVNGRNNLPWSERLALDAWYVDHLSLWLDLKILGRTLAQIIQTKNVQVVPNLAMPDLDEERGIR